MPSDVVTIVVSTGIGVSVIAGVLSGVCYILAHGFTRKRSRKPVLQWHCAVCGTYLRSRIVENTKAVICLECEERVCKLRCSKREYVKKGWICYNCLKRPSWIQGLISSIHLNYKGFRSKDKNRIDEMDENIEELKKQEKDHVRDFIEKLVSTILGGNVDDASVFKMYNDKHYDILFERYHQDLSNAITNLSSALHISLNNAPVLEQSPCTAHANLKQLIEKLLREILYIPSFDKAVEHPISSAPEEGERTYEDLLATAILNKVITKCQNNLPSSSGASVSSRISASSQKENKEYFFGEETLENKWKNTDLDSTSNSSFDEYLQSDSSLGSVKYVDRVSLTIQQRIEEASPSDAEEEVIEDDSQYFRSNSSLLNNDDSNWYLQKRHFHGTHSPVPVPMLVPNPVTNAKVLIGDREVDETSDLSDAISDYENDMDSVPGIQSFMIESKMIIGGKNLINGLQTNTVSESETSADSGVREDRDDISEQGKSYHKPKTDITVDDENVEDVSIISVHSNVEKDSEYLEKYASLPRTIHRSSPPSLNSSQIVTQKQPDDTDLQIQNEIHDETDDHENIIRFQGRYSKREKEKWNNPIKMQYNPYSKENIEKRIKSSQIYGRDYYTKQASLPSGTAKPNEDIRKFWLNKQYSTDEEPNIFRAEPITTEELETEVAAIIPEAIEESEENLPVSDVLSVLSDSDISLVNCYDVENSKIYHQATDGTHKEIRIQVNTEGLLYNPKDFENSDMVNGGETEDTEESKDIEPKIIPEKETESVYISETVLVKPDKQPEIQPKVKPRTFVNKIEFPVSPKRSKFPDLETSDKTRSENQTSSLFVTKKSDNTLIKKIYSDPVVRSFALTNREQIPVDITKKTESPKTPEREEHIKPVETSTPKTKKNIQVKTNDVVLINDNNEEVHIQRAFKDVSIDSNDEEIVSNNTFSLEFSDNESFHRKPSIEKQDITELKEKGLVASRLGEFSKSFPNLSKTSLYNNKKYRSVSREKRETSFESSFEDEPPVQSFTSVKDLRKLFEKNDAYKKDKPVHSLTARSLSKQMKERLKGYNSDENGNLIE